MADATENQFLGALLGMAIGDALGAPAIGFDRNDVRARFGMIDSFLDSSAPGGEEGHAGEFTDETEFALCIVESMTVNRGAFDAETAGVRLLHLATGPSRHWIQSRTLAALEAANASLDFVVPLDDDGAATGDVAARGVPVGLVHAVGSFDADALRADAEAVVRLTHGGPAAINAAAAAVAYGVRLAATGAPRAAWARQTAEFLGGGEVADRLHETDPLVASNLPLADVLERVGTELSATESVPAAFAAAMREEVFEDAVLAAVNAGGAADTVGALDRRLCRCCRRRLWHSAAADRRTGRSYLRLTGGALVLQGGAPAGWPPHRPSSGPRPTSRLAAAAIGRASGVGSRESGVGSRVSGDRSRTEFPARCQGSCVILSPQAEDLGTRIRTHHRAEILRSSGRHGSGRRDWVDPVPGWNARSGEILAEIMAARLLTDCEAVGTKRVDRPVAAERGIALARHKMAGAGGVGLRTNVRDQRPFPLRERAQRREPAWSRGPVVGNGGLPVVAGEEPVAQFADVTESQRQAFALRRVVRTGRVADEDDALASDAVGNNADTRKERHGSLRAGAGENAFRIDGRTGRDESFGRAAAPDLGRSRGGTDEIGSCEAAGVAEDERFRPRDARHVTGIRVQFNVRHQATADDMMKRILDGMRSHPAAHAGIAAVRPHDKTSSQYGRPCFVLHCQSELPIGVSYDADSLRRANRVRAHL